MIKREQDIVKFISILEKKDKLNNEIESFNVVLNGKWGDGKTTFFNQCKDYIKEKEYDGIKIENIIEISAWDYDFLDDPLEMIYEIFSGNYDVLSTV